jgi:valyl-tRNA synthetase
MSLRPQAHEIIRTWAFYTIVQSLYHFGEPPWQDVAISGWGLAPQGSGKISKSRGGGQLAPMETLRRFSADGARYWAASTGLGKDSIISEEKMQAGEKLVRKLWSVASFGRTFLEAPIPELPIDDLTSGDRWILAALQELIEHVGRAFEEYDYVSAKNDTEIFFWRDLCDNYLEMAKRRLYDAASPGHEAARFSLHAVLSTVLRLFAPILPYATDEIYSRLLEPGRTIHRAAWPQPEARLRDEGAVRNGQVLVDIATAVRRFKSMHALSLGAPLARLDIGCEDRELRAWLRNGIDDMLSVTRAHDVRLCADPPEQAEPIGDRLGLSMAIRV